MGEHADSDAVLVARAGRGEDAAFELLYRRHRDWVVALAYRFTGNRDDALDVLQDTFAYLFRRIPDLELTGSLRALLYPTVKHLSIDRVRRRMPGADDAEPIERMPDPQPGDAGASLGLERALGDLPAAQREVILLRFVDDLSLEQIAAAVAVPLGTVKSRLHHALATLRRRLKKD